MMKGLAAEIEEAEEGQAIAGELRSVDRDGVPQGLQYAMRCGCKSFALAYFIRFGVSVALHYFKSLRKNPSFLR